MSMKEIRLAQALIPLRRSYNQAHRLVALGLLKGRRDDDGRWWVDAKDLERFVTAEHRGQENSQAA